MALHRLRMDQRNLRRLASQYLRQLVHGALADTNIVWFDGGTGDVHDSLVDHFHQLSRRGPRRLSVRTHIYVGHLAKHRITLLVELLPPFVGVPVEHRSATRTIGAFHGFLRVGHQVHDLATVGNVFRQTLLDGRSHRGTPSQGEDAVEVLKHVEYDIAFQLTELGFAVPFEIFGNPHSRIQFDLIVRIGERQVHHLRHFLADARLAGAHHADDHRKRPTHAAHSRITSCVPARKPHSFPHCAWFRPHCLHRTSPARTARW